VADPDASLVQKILPVPQRKRETNAEHHGQPDNLGAVFEVEGERFVIRQSYETAPPASSRFPLTKPYRPINVEKHNS
jgi:hypothetical protein